MTGGSLVILTGAGISAEGGLGTFRCAIGAPIVADARPQRTCPEWLWPRAFEGASMLHLRTHEGGPRARSSPRLPRWLSQRVAVWLKS